MTATMRRFALVWTGQTVSQVGSGLTAFALGVWVFQRTGSASHFALIFVFAELPGLLLSPLAGTVVDRFDRRRVMMASDAAAGIATLGIAIAAGAGALEVVHIYIAVSFISLATALQVPAYLASVPLLVPGEQLGRANGLVQTAQALRQVVAPALAGALLGIVALAGIVAIDAATLAFALITLALVRFPSPAPAEGTESPASFTAELAFGLRFIARRRALAAVLTVIGLFLFVLSIIGVLITPMILAFTTPAMLGLLTSIGGVGMLAGGLTLSAWGGPERRIHGVLGALFIGGILLSLHGLRPSSLLIGVLAFGFFFTLPFVLGLNDTIWQSQVPSAVQGKVFATREMLTRSMVPLGYFVAGPLADRIFEPLLAPGGTLADTLGRTIGVGPGRGIALMFILGGALISLLAALAALYRPLREIESHSPEPGPAESASPQAPATDLSADSTETAG